MRQNKERGEAGERSGRKRVKVRVAKGRVVVVSFNEGKYGILLFLSYSKKVLSF